jgi:RNA polymerase primary sigma factor
MKGYHSSIQSSWLPSQKVLRQSGNAGHSAPDVAPYLADLQRLAEPLLTREEEQALASAIQQGDQKARRRFIQANLRLVVAVARKIRQQYATKSIEMSELIQEGNAALIHAVDKFDPKRKVRFSTYATWWVYQAMYNRIHQSGYACRIPGNTLTMLNHLRRAIQTWQDVNNTSEQPCDDYLAERLNVSVSKVQELKRVGQQAVSIDQPVSDAVGNTFTPRSLADDRVDLVETVYEKELRQKLRNAFVSHLSDKEQAIIQQHFGISFTGGDEPLNQLEGTKPLHEIGQQFGVSREAIRKAERRALNKLRGAIDG